MKATLIHLFILLTITVSGQPESFSAEPIHQLRIYEIFKENKQAFHARFRDDASRIMRKYDFKIVAIWETEKDERTEFVYILEWENEKMMKDAWAKFMADQEWIAIKKKTSVLHGTLVGEIDDRVLRLKEYSPSKSLLKEKL